MADNVTIPTTGSGTATPVVATDDVAGVHFQKVKLIDGTADASTAIAAGGGVEAGALRVTLASDSTGVVSVDDNGGSLTVDGTVTANLAAGSNNIGDMDVLSVIPSTGATNLGKAVDAPAGATDTGVAGLAVRDDALTTLTPVDGDYVNERTNARGANWVAIEDGAGGQITSFGGGTQYTEGDTDASITGTAALMEGAANTLLPVQGTVADGLLVNLGANNDVTVTGVATETTLASLLTSSQLIDDAIATLGTNTYTEATTKGQTIGAVRRDADTTLVDTTNEIGPLQMDANGRLKVEIFDGGDSHTVDGTVAVSTLPALVAGTANIGDVDVLTLPALVAGSANIGDVDILTIAAGDNNIGNVDIVSLPASTNTIEVVGDVAHDAAAAGNPVQVAGTHETMADSAPTNRLASVTDGDVTRLSATDGALFVIPTGPQMFSYHDDDVAAVTTDGAVHSAPAAGLSVYITDIVFSIGVATASSIFIEESTTKVLGPYYLEAIAGRGLSIHLGTPKKITSAVSPLVTNTGATTFGVDITGFIAPG